MDEVVEMTVRFWKSQWAGLKKLSEDGKHGGQPIAYHIRMAIAAYLRYKGIAANNEPIKPGRKPE